MTNYFRPPVVKWPFNRQRCQTKVAWKIIGKPMIITWQGRNYPSQRFNNLSAWQSSSLKLARAVVTWPTKRTTGNASTSDGRRAWSVSRATSPSARTASSCSRPCRRSDAKLSWQLSLPGVPTSSLTVVLLPRQIQPHKIWKTTTKWPSWRTQQSVARSAPCKVRHQRAEKRPRRP